MTRPKGSKNKKLNEAPKEVIHANFLKAPEDVPEMNTEIVFQNEVPKMETIVFQNFRDGNNVPLQFFLHTRNHPLKHYTLMPGHTYTLPREVVMHLEGQLPEDPYACHKTTYAKREVKTGMENMPEMSQTYELGHEPCFSCKTVRKR